MLFSGFVLGFGLLVGFGVFLCLMFKQRIAVARMLKEKEKKAQSPTQNQTKNPLQHIELPFTVVSNMFNEGHMS